MIKKTIGKAQFLVHGSYVGGIALFDAVKQFFGTVEVVVGRHHCTGHGDQTQQADSFVQRPALYVIPRKDQTCDRRTD